MGIEHIAVIHAGAVGDLVQALPALAAVRAAWPAARLTLVGRPERAALARLAGVVDACADLETAGVWRLAGGQAAPDARGPALLREAGLVVDFLTRGTVARGLAAAGDPPGGGAHVLPAGREGRRASPAANAAARPAGGGPAAARRPRVVAVEPLPPAGWEGSAAAWIAGEVARCLGLRPESTVPEIRLTGEDLAAARETLARRRVAGPFLAVHLGSGSVRKNWPADRFAAVARHERETAGRETVWLAGPAEAERRTLPPAPGGVVLADLALERVAAVLALADAYLGNDSGVTQVAAAVRRPDGRPTPVVALFGPTDARVWAPRGGHVRVVRSADNTMGAIPVGEVREAVAAALG